MTNLVASRPTAGRGRTRATTGGLATLADRQRRRASVLVVGLAVASGNGIYLLGAVGFVVALLLVGHAATRPATSSPARRYGMKATQFFCGFGPTVWSRQRGETGVRRQGHPGRRVRQDRRDDLAGGGRARRREARVLAPARRQRVVVLAAGSTVHFILAVLLVLLSSFAIGKAVERAPSVGALAECVPVVRLGGRLLRRPGRAAVAGRGGGSAAGDVLVSVDGSRPRATCSSSSRSARAPAAPSRSSWSATASSARSP
jgi:membrane-associated protease RseP (regulator of RpoE activity)